MKLFLIPVAVMLVFSAVSCRGEESLELDDTLTDEEVVEPAETAEEVEESITANDLAPASSSETEIIQGRSMDSIRRELLVINQALQPAYEELLENNPTASGTIEISFSITPEGSVTDMVVLPDDDLLSLASNLEGLITALNFEVCTEQVENIPITVPVNLTPPE